MRPFVFRCLGISLVIALVLRTMGNAGAGWAALIGAALFLGLLNALVRPVVLRLPEGHHALAMALVILALNALFLAGLRGAVPVYEVQPLSSAVGGALLVSVISWLLNFFFRGRDGHVHAVTEHPNPAPSDQAAP